MPLLLSRRDAFAAAAACRHLAEILAGDAATQSNWRIKEQTLVSVGKLVQLAARFDQHATQGQPPDTAHTHPPSASTRE